VELVLVRHALPVRVEGTAGADPPLDDVGERQATALAQWLAEEEVHGIYVSPMRRARETAAPLEAVTGRVAVVDEDLAEFDRGWDFYIPMEDLKEEGHEHWQVLASGRWEDIPGDIFGFRKRVVEAVERIVAAHPSQRIAVVSHGGVVNSYASHVLGIEAPLFFEPAYTSITRVLAASSGARSILSLNESAHLRHL
jgi:probable phosphoglycerate mutase